MSNLTARIKRLEQAAGRKEQEWLTVEQDWDGADVYYLRTPYGSDPHSPGEFARTFSRAELDDWTKALPDNVQVICISYVPMDELPFRL